MLNKETYHVASSRHASARQTLDALTKVLNDVSRATADRELASQVQNDILGASPSTELANKLDTEDLRRLQLPRRTDHSVHSIRTANTDRNRAQTASVRGMRVRAQRHETRRRVVLQNGLVDDARARRPELNAVLLRRALQEVIHLLIAVDAVRQVEVRAALADNHVVAVDAAGHGGLRQAAAHELQQGHLRRGVLHGDAVDEQLEVGLGAHIAAAVGVGQERLFRVLVQVAVEDLLGERELLVGQQAADLVQVAEQLGVGWRARLEGGGGGRGGLLGDGSETVRVGGGGGEGSREREEGLLPPGGQGGRRSPCCQHYGRRGVDCSRRESRVSGNGECE